MKSRDLDKLRALDPKVAAQLEDVLRRKAEGSSDEASACESAERGVVECSEVNESPPLLRSEVDVSDGGDTTPSRSAPSRLSFRAPESSAEVETPPQRSHDPDARSERPPMSAAPSPNTKKDDVGDLVASARRPLPFNEDAPVPACKRTAESQALPTWHARSTRREHASFDHPAEFAHVRAFDDAELSKRWGWLCKHRCRGLSDLDQAVQREIYARCLGYRDLYGLRYLPRASAWLVEALRAMGCRSTIAHTLVSLLELSVQRGRWAVRISAPEARSLYGWSLSGWWSAVARLEELGVIGRVRSPKDNDGPEPVQVDTNLYVLGPWWVAAEEGGLAPLQAVVALLDPQSPKNEVHREVLVRRRERRRETNTATRDRNRRRGHALPPRVVSTRAVVQQVDRIAARVEKVQEREQRSFDLERARLMLRGQRSPALGERRVLAKAVFVDSSDAEFAAASHVEASNKGESSCVLDAHFGVLRDAVSFLEAQLPSEIATALPKGKIDRKKLSLGSPPPPFKANTSSQDLPTTARPSSISSTTSSDSSPSQQHLGARARALDDASNRRTQARQPFELFLRDKFREVYGAEMPDSLAPP